MLEKKIEIYNEDCLEGMKRIPSGAVDCVVCDLPYYKVVGADFDNEWKSEDGYLEFVRACAAEWKRVLKNGGNVFAFTSRQMNRKVCAVLDELFEERRIIIWARKRGFNTTRGKALSSGYEPICYYCNGPEGTFHNLKVFPKSARPEYKTGVLRNGVDLSDVWADIPALPHNSKERLPHPTQKPLKLIERILEMGTDPGDLVLDPCAGSGTTGEACRLLGRKFIGFEKNPEYFKIAEKRLDGGSAKLF